VPPSPVLNDLLLETPLGLAFLIFYLTLPPPSNPIVSYAWMNTFCKNYLLTCPLPDFDFKKGYFSIILSATQWYSSLVGNALYLKIAEQMLDINFALQLPLSIFLFKPAMTSCG